MGWGKAIKSRVKAERKKKRSRGDSTHQNKEKHLETLAEETRAETEKYAESMGRGRRRKRIRCVGSAGDGGWFSASGGNDGRELPCRSGELQGQTKMIWDKDSPNQERTELPVSSPCGFGVFFCHDFPWLYTETSEGFHSFLQRITMPVM